MLEWNRRERNIDKNSFIPHQRIGVTYCIILIAVAIVISGLIAVGTHYRAHPDEYYHADAFRYFEQHWWPPNLGSNEVIYSPQGWSRVYTGEIVYLIFGKLSRAIQFFWKLGKWRFLAYRLSNVGLFLLTLGALFFTRCKWVNIQLIGLVFLGIPQVHYIYAYANSDAWGLSMGVFLFLVVAVMLDKSISSWGWTHFIYLGALTGLVFVSKKPYLFSLILPYSLLVGRLWQLISEGFVHLRWLFNRLVVALLLAFAIAMPLRLIYPLTQGHFPRAIKQMRESRAADEFKPSNPTYPTHHLASKGEGYYDLLVKRSWMGKTLKSFYGLFGYMNVRNPNWIYKLAGLGALLAICATTLSASIHWSKLSYPLQISIVLSPVIITLNTIASMVRSLHVGFQPQGRYLFPALVPVALIVTGTVPSESRKLKMTRLLLFAVLYLACLYSLVTTVLLNPALSRF
jgi:hypothetical protein